VKNVLLDHDEIKTLKNNLDKLVKLRKDAVELMNSKCFDEAIQKLNQIMIDPETEKRPFYQITILKYLGEAYLE